MDSIRKQTTFQKFMKDENATSDFNSDSHVIDSEPDEVHGNVEQKTR